MMRSRSDGGIREDHQEPVDAEPQAARGRHAVLERAEELLVQRMCLPDARRFQLLLELELRALLQGSVSSENAVTSSTPPMMRSKCSVSWGSDR